MPNVIANLKSESDKYNQFSRSGGGGKLSHGEKGKSKKMKESMLIKMRNGERRIQMALLASTGKILNNIV